MTVTEMSSLQRNSSVGQKRLPVFVFPEELKFVAEDDSSHKQVLTLYNPYDFNIKFQVLSNAPNKYAVVESQGHIKAHCCIDIVVRHRTASDGPFDVTDKFRIDMSVDRKLVGRKQILSTLVRKLESSKEKVERSSEFKLSGSLPVDSKQAPTPTVQPISQGHTVLMMAVALVCLLVLLLPLVGEASEWPSYLHVTVNQKLIAAFALGLVTMAILKS